MLRLWWSLKPITVTDLPILHYRRAFEAVEENVEAVEETVEAVEEDLIVTLLSYSSGERLGAADFSAYSTDGHPFPVQRCL